MKTKSIAIFLILTVLCAFNAWSEESPSDGNYWRMVNISQKAAFIHGFILASSLVSSAIIADTIFYLEEHYNKKVTAKEEDILSSETKKFPLSEWRYAITDIKNGQIVDGLNILYEDFKNRNIKIFDAIYVIKKQIRGTPPEDIERILLYLRGNRKDVSLLFVKDLKGKTIRVIKFP